MTRWLSIDWDIVTGDCRDPLDGHGCVWRCEWCNFTPNGCVEMMNHDFVGMYFTLEALVGKLAFGDTVVVDCHASLYRYLGRGDVVVNLDWHTDMEREQLLDCGSWGYLAKEKKGCKCSTYVDLDGLDIGPFDRCCLCLSSPFTPREVDAFFARLVGVLGSVSEKGARFRGRGGEALARRMRPLMQRRSRRDGKEL